MDCWQGWVVHVLPLNVLPLIFPYISSLFHNLNLSSTCTPLNSDLGQSKLFYLIYGMIDRVGSTCTASRSLFVFKAIVTFLADYAKLMVVHVLL